jgi:assimilatory nitrate reductase catalytic subunit
MSLNLNRQTDNLSQCPKFLDHYREWIPAGAEGGKARLYANGVFPTSNGKARFKGVQHQACAEVVDARLPLHLNSGRLRDQWHGMSRTGVVPRLFAHAPEPTLEMHARDMERRHLADGDLVRMKGKRGNLVVRVAASNTLRPSHVHMPMHWGGHFMRGHGVNTLTVPTTDPISRQPELKHAAVQVEKLAIGWQLVAMRIDVAGTLHAALKPWLKRFEYATLNWAGRDPGVAVFRAWGATDSVVPGATVLDELAAVLGMEGNRVSMFNDARRGVSKRALIEEGHLAGALLCNETRATDWLLDVMITGGDTQELRKWIFAPVAAAPSSAPARGRVICNCFDVSENEILADVVSGMDLESIQAKRKCGTSCGSCVPELKRLAK